MGWNKNTDIAAIIIFTLFCGSVVYAQEEPTFPPGLDENIPSPNEPTLPMGLEDSNKEPEPSLPAGLGEETDEPTLPAGLDKQEEEDKINYDRENLQEFPFDYSGFWELRLGARTQKDQNEKDLSIGETRLQLQLEKSWKEITFHLANDFIYDPVLDRHKINLNTGDGILDLREANLLLRPADFMDLKAGRQILTWGTGDLIFINDLFPKDWNSFFIGRDSEYLKAPSDAVKVSFFSNLANLDIIYTPQFDSDRFIDGRRISFFNNVAGRLTGRNAIAVVNKRNNWFSEDEIAWRVYRNIGGYEPAFYGYLGFWKSPAGVDPSTGKATFPALTVYGASVRGAFAKGIANLELGYYNSEDDPVGNNPSIRNSEFRFLAGYEIEGAKDFIVGIQYYLEHIIKYNNLIKALPAGSMAADENRHVVTLRLTRLLLNQNMILSLFTFYSPSDNDAYLRPKIHYKIDDHWSVESGGNIFRGKDNHTFFGQFAKNTNGYFALRYNY